VVVLVGEVEEEFVGLALGLGSRSRDCWSSVVTRCGMVLDRRISSRSNSKVEVVVALAMLAVLGKLAV
jgi:hypothetical protein